MAAQEIVHAVWCVDMREEQATRYRVLSISYLSDGPSRFDFEEVKRLGGVWTVLVACDPQVFWSGAGSRNK